MESILTSIKKLLGPEEAYEHFDTDIIVHINTALMRLRRLGVGPKEGFLIEDSSAMWSDFLGDDPRLEGVKTYVYLRVKLLFDPPTSSAVLQSFKETINELEWVLNDVAEFDPME